MLSKFFGLKCSFSLPGMDSATCDSILPEDFDFETPVVDSSAFDDYADLDALLEDEDIDLREESQSTLGEADQEDSWPIPAPPFTPFFMVPPGDIGLDEEDALAATDLAEAIGGTDTGAEVTGLPDTSQIPSSQ